MESQRFHAPTGRAFRWKYVNCLMTFVIGQLFLRLLGHFDFRRADLFDFDGRGAVHVTLISVERDFPAHFQLLLFERAVFEPELHGAFGIADRRAIAAPGPASECEHRFGGFLRQFAGQSAAIFGEVLCARREFRCLSRWRFEGSRCHGPETRRPLRGFKFREGLPAALGIADRRLVTLQDGLRGRVTPS